MNLKEFNEFSLDDAIHFHDELNPAVFQGDEMRPDVREQLLLISEDFVDHLGINHIVIKDITISGSSAAYSYTRHSDIDLHILVDMSQFSDDDVYRELFNAKKVVYNAEHDITIGGYDVELYVQDANQPVISLGEYSVMNDKWIRLPRKRKANLDQNATKLKFEKILKLAEFALKSNDVEKIENVLGIIKKYRQAGLDLNGEFGPENLAFKILRSKGVIKKLYNKLEQLHSERLSLPETKTKTIKKDNLADKLFDELYKFKADEDYDPNGKPPGPEFKPTMPAGTVKVDVSDVYDWYKLGQHISNLKGLGHHDFGKGPPSTIMAFGSEPEEHKYIKDLKKTGLTTTDIDPYDPNQPKDMPRQKVDPTYNVNEKINPEVTKQDFRAEKDINVEGVGPLKLIAYNLTPDHPPQFRIEAIRPDGKSIAYFRFIVMDYESEPKYKLFAKFKDKKDPYVIGGNVSVWSEYQKKGIATQVYQWVKSMGNDIKPSDTQTPAGKAMWRGFEKNKTMQGVDEVVNPDVTSDEYYNDPTKNVRMGEFEFNARTFTGGLGNPNARGLQIRAYDPTQPKGQNLIGSADFIVKSDKKGNQWLESDDTEVNDEYRGKGVAAMMYAFAKSLGNDVKASPYQSQKGREMWKKWGSDSKHLVGEASGYIPSESEKNDPRFKTALTVDVKPDSIKKNAKAFGFKVSRAGIPPLLRK